MAGKCTATGVRGANVAKQEIKAVDRGTNENRVSDPKQGTMKCGNHRQHAIGQQSNEVIACCTGIVLEFSWGFSIPTFA